MGQPPWRTTSLGTVVTLQRGFDLPTRLRHRGTVPIVSSSGVSGWHDRPMVRAPGVVTGRYGTIGQVFFQEKDFWPLNTTLWVSRFHGNDEKFVYYLLHRVDFSTHSGKSGVPGVNRNDLHTEIVSVPREKDEQRRIAEALSDVDHMVAILERLIAKKQEIKQGMAQELLSGRTRLPGFLGGWVDASLGKIARVKTGSRNTEDKQPSGLYPFFVRSAKIERINSYSHDCEAILVPGEGGIGSIFHYINGKFEVHQRVYKISDFDPSVCAKFIYYVMQLSFGRHARENSVKATVDSLRLPTFLNFTVHLPPERGEQTAIARVLDETGAELDQLHSRLRKARNIRQGMMQELLTGRTRLVTPGASA
ncbi:MAG: restriction endonuclease subunit S [Thermoleophilia bacterium]